MHRIPIMALTGAVTVVMVAGCGSRGTESSGGVSGDTLTIGASMSLTGSLAREGQLTKEGYDLCIQKVNAAGGVTVDGKKVKLKVSYQDDTSKPDTAAQLVDQYNDKGVKLILSSYGTPNAAAQAPVVERNGQVMVDTGGADDAIFHKGYKRTFAVLSPATQYAASIVQALNDLAKPKPKKVVFLSADDAFSKTVTGGGEAMAKKLGMTVLPAQYFPESSTDVSSSLNKVKAQKPDVIIGSVHLVEGVAIMKQSSELGVKPSGGFAETVAPPTPDFSKTLGKLAENVLSSSQWSPTVKGEDKYFGTGKDFGADIQKRYGHAADYHNAEAAAGCLALTEAVQNAGSADVDKVRDSLAKLDIPSAFGHLKFNSLGQNVYKPMSVIQVQDGKPVTVWPKDEAEAKLNWPGTAS